MLWPGAQWLGRGELRAALSLCPQPLGRTLPCRPAWVTVTLCLSFLIHKMGTMEAFLKDS